MKSMSVSLVLIVVEPYNCSRKVWVLAKKYECSVERENEIWNKEKKIKTEKKTTFKEERIREEKKKTVCTWSRSLWPDMKNKALDVAYKR